MLQFLIKKITLFALFSVFAPLLCTAQTFGEVSFGYDANGNRVSNSIRFGVEMRNGANLDTLYVNSVSDVLNNMEIALFPNPTCGMFSVSLNGTETFDAHAVLSTIGGAPLEKKEINNGLVEFDLSSQSAGLYVVTLTVNGESKSWSVLKK